MLCAIRAFKQNNPGWTDVKVIIIDEAYTELSLLREQFPCATVIHCHFHVIDYLNREVSKKNYGFSSFEKMHIKNILAMMVRTATESEFDDYLAALQQLCTGKPSFYGLFYGELAQLQGFVVHVCAWKHSSSR